MVGGADQLPITKATRDQADAQGWSLLTVALPYLGPFIYLIVRGHSVGRLSREVGYRFGAAGRGDVTTI